MVNFAGKSTNDHIDFIAINPKLKIDEVRKKIDGKLNYKEIIDYHFVTNTLKSGYLQNYEKYSLYINVDELAFNEKEVSAPSKKPKMDEEEQEESNITVKLSDD